MEIHKENLETQGYTIIKSVFNTDEIEQFRSLVEKQQILDRQNGLASKFNLWQNKAEFYKGDIYSKKFIRDIALSDKFLKTISSILGSPLVYFKDSSYNVGNGFRGYHRDNIDRDYKGGPDWNTQYDVYRLGIYLQDHDQFSGGLKVRPSSHINETGESLFVNSKAGDIVLWNMRLLHSGNAVRLKIFTNFTINTAGKESLIPTFLRRQQHMERMSIFIAFGKPGIHLNRYIEKHMLGRADMIEHTKYSVIDSSVKERLEKYSITLFDLNDEQTGNNVPI